jgi:hypothetical protein
MGGSSSKTPALTPQQQAAVDALDRHISNFGRLRSSELLKEWPKGTANAMNEMGYAVGGFWHGNGKGRAAADALRARILSGEVTATNIESELARLREAAATDLVAILQEYLHNRDLVYNDARRLDLTDAQKEEARSYILTILSGQTSGSYERVLGGAWGIAKEHPIQCVALALLIVGAIFLLVFIFNITKDPAAKSAGTLVGCGFMSAAVAAVGVAWLVTE